MIALQVLALLYLLVCVLGVFTALTAEYKDGTVIEYLTMLTPTYWTVRFLMWRPFN